MTLFIGMFLFYSCGNSSEQINQITINANDPDEVSEDVTLFFSDVGKTKVKLESPLVHRYFIPKKNKAAKPSIKMECLNGMKITFYDTTGNVKSILTSKQGTIQPASEIIQVKDSVVFKNYKKEVLTTELLNIDLKKDSIYTNQKVNVNSPIKGNLTGHEIISNSTFTKYKVKKIINSTLYINTEEFNNE